eukprot:15345260-Heterocapsa_arctica.AAC.1
MFDSLQKQLNKNIIVSIDHTSERDQHTNEGKHHSEYSGTRTDLKATTAFGASGHAGHRKFSGKRTERTQSTRTTSCTEPEASTR